MLALAGSTRRWRSPPSRRAGGDDDLADHAVGPDEELGRQAVDLVAMEDVGPQVGRHGVRQAVFRRVRADVGLARLLDADADDREAARGVGIRDRPQDRCLGLAGWAPAGPEVDPDGPTAQLVETDRATLEIDQLELASVRPGEAKLRREVAGLQPLGAAATTGCTASAADRLGPTAPTDPSGEVTTMNPIATARYGHEDSEQLSSTKGPSGHGGPARGGSQGGPSASRSCLRSSVRPSDGRVEVEIAGQEREPVEQHRHADRDHERAADDDTSRPWRSSGGSRPGARRRRAR